MRPNNYRNTLIRLLFLLCLVACSDSDPSNSPAPTGQGGSTARFTVHGSYLYTVIDDQLSVFDLTRRDTLVHAYTGSLPFGIETVHAQGGYLYLGAQNGMYIYSLMDPAQPSFVFQYQHIRSCDPVVVQGKWAYVTLRGGNTCGSSSNTLEIIDIQDPNQPILFKSYPLTHPYGLAIDGNMLFVCDGALKLFDVSNPANVRLLTSAEINNPHDVIVSNGLATVTSAEGILQYSYGADHLTLLSTIPVEIP
ncbi:hypothetical protein KK062_17835 [Fulvivirgaceae bacterium PWU5]|uniref:LVIVD repeat-containing protein n=1 Tax=Dawidia cretensis TaxID=2782350 RepID=A0AAP2GW45_9BACT|nr:hypothetical protein [Dawidia cretensis]MBT1710112.1 hypothetical protein [Dawidia cretensis]